MARLAIGGLDLPPALGRRGLDGLLGWEGGPGEESRWARSLLLTAAVPTATPDAPAACRGAGRQDVTYHTRCDASMPCAWWEALWHDFGSVTAAAGRRRRWGTRR